MINEVNANISDKMNKTIDVYKDELKSIRAGRANPHILDRIEIDYYGTMSPLKQVSNISVPEPRMLVISPWDASLIPVIEKAILISDIGINPSNDGKIIRLSIPELTEERRKQLVKQLHKLSEDAKIAIRNERRIGNEELKKQFKNQEITEDDFREGEKNIQKLTDDNIIKIDTLSKEKEKEILEI